VGTAQLTRRKESTAGDVKVFEIMENCALRLRARGPDPDRPVAG